MKKIILLTLFSVFSLFAQDAIHFNDGEFWNGKLNKLEEERLHLSSEIAGEDLQFYLKNLKYIFFGKSKSLKGNFKVLLTNGDGVTGELDELNKEFLVIKTENAGLLQIPRNFVSYIEAIEDSNIISEGITKDEGWSAGLNPDSSMQRTVTRNLKISEPLIISTSIEIENAHSFYVMLNNLRTRNTARFYLTSQISSSSRRMVVVNGKAVMNNDGNRRVYSSLTNGTERVNLGNKELDGANNKVTLDIYLNPQESFVAVKINNIEVGKAKLNSQFEFDQLNLNIRHHGGKVFIRKFAIKKWNGQYSNYGSAEGSEVNDNIYLVNGDVAEGKVVSIKNGRLFFETKLGPMDIPMDRVLSSKLKNDPVESGDELFRIQQKNGQFITGNLQKIDDDFIYLKSTLLENLKLKREFTSYISRAGEQEKSDNAPEVVTFGKNKIFGKIVSLKNTKLKIENKNLANDLELDIKNISSVKLEQSSNASSKLQWITELTNGDSIPGKIVSFNEKEVVIESHSGNFTFPVDKVSRMHQGALNQVRSYSNRGAVNQVVFTTRSSTPIELDLPERCEINFDVEPAAMRGIHWNAYFQMRLFGDKVSRDSYYFQFSSRPRMTYKRNIDNKQHKKVKFAGKVRASLKVDRKKGIFELWINGEHTNTFKDKDGFQGKGNFVIIYRNNNVKISRLHFKEWSEGSDPYDEFTITKDWKIHKGAVNKIEDGKAFIGTKEFKLDSLQEIAFNAPAHDKKAGKSIFLILQNNGTLSAESFEISDDKITIQHPLRGEIILKKKDVKHINIQQESAQKIIDQKIRERSVIIKN